MNGPVKLERQTRLMSDTRLSQERAEILRLITQLTARRFSLELEPRPIVEQRREPTPLKKTRYPAAPQQRSNEGLSDRATIALLRSLEARLTRIEEQLAKRRSSRPSPAAAKQKEQEQAQAEAQTDEEPATFSGVIQGQMLSDMLQLVSSNDLSGLFVVESGGNECRLYFQLGRICHAEAPGLKGEEAFFAAFGADEGRYWFREMPDMPAEKTIDSGTQFLILEALRRIDESRA